MNATGSSQAEPAMEHITQDLSDCIGNNENIEAKIEPFKFLSLFEFTDELDNLQWTLKALSELIGTSSDLGMFSENTQYRYGLQQLFEMCIEKQSDKVNALRQLVSNSPEYVIDSAKNFYRQIPPSQYNKSVIAKIIRELDIIIKQFGSDEYPEARIIRDQIISKAPNSILSRRGN